MSKAKFFSHEERLAMTQRDSALLRGRRDGKDLPPAYHGSEKHSEPEFDGVHCPSCGTKLIHESCCVRCPNGCWSKCG